MRVTIGDVPSSVLDYSECISLELLVAGLEYRYSNIDITEIPKLFSVIF